nr:hypothetical protein [Tanacetum cinerariifolium]
EELAGMNMLEGTKKQQVCDKKIIKSYDLRF